MPVKKREIIQSMAHSSSRLSISSHSSSIRNILHYCMTGKSREIRRQKSQGRRQARAQVRLLKEQSSKTRWTLRFFYKTKTTNANIFHSIVCPELRVDPSRSLDSQNDRRRRVMQKQPLVRFRTNFEGESPFITQDDGEKCMIV